MSRRHGQKITQLVRALLAIGTLLPAYLAADVRYDVRVNGLEDDPAIKVLEDSSLLITLRERPPSTMTGLRRRAEADIDELLSILHNFSYHEASIRFEIVPGTRRNLVNLLISPGPRYIIGETRLINSADLHPHEEGPRQPSILDHLGTSSHDLRPGDRATSTKFLEGEAVLLRSLAKQGYPLAQIKHRDLRVDLKTRQVHVDFYLFTGPQAHFGKVTIEGLDSVKEQFVFDDILWCKGEIFDPIKIEQTEEALLGRQLFNLVHISHAKEIDEEGLLPIEIKLQEGLHRSIGGGLSYTTQLGPGLSFEWENRNISGLGKRVTLLADLWSKRQKALLSYLRPNFGCPDQDFLLIAEYENEETQSFEEYSFSTSGILSYRITDRQAISYGATIKQLRSKGNEKDRDDTLLKIPLEYRFAAVNNLLDPTDGRRIILKVTPVQLLNRGDNWVDTRVTGIWYRPLNRNDQFVLAFRAVLASLAGAGTSDIPAPERLYGGNETTLRGYKYQTVSPRDINGDPVGGRSMLVFSTEARIKTSERISAVLFHEYGNVYADSLPDFNAGIVHSLGLGIRYHTAVGPLRLDIAFPLNRRKGLDPAFQLYFSIGQSF